MSRIQRSDLRDFDYEAYADQQTPADGLVILTEDDWNRNMRSSTIAAVFKRDAHPAPEDPTIVDLGGGDYVDCSVLNPVPHQRIGSLWQPSLTTTEKEAVDEGVRLHLCIDQLKDLAQEPEHHVGPAAWVPEQGMVRKVDWPPGDPHMIAILSSTASNARLGTCTGVLLTSHTKTQRKRWEVPVSGGYTVVGDVFTFDNEEIRQTVQRGRPDRLDRTTLASIALQLERVLELEP